MENLYAPLLRSTPTAYCFLLLPPCDKFRIPASKVVITDSPTAGHQSMGKLNGSELHIVSRILEPAHAFKSRCLILFDHRLAGLLKILQRFSHALASAEAFKK